MAVKRPGYQPNVKANADSTKRKSIFFDLKPDTTTRLRVLPANQASGLIFTEVCNHFKLKDDANQGIAVACLNVHGNPAVKPADREECYICDLVAYLRKGDKAMQKIAKDCYASSKWYMQALVVLTERGPDKKTPTLMYTGPYLVGLSRKTAEDVGGLLGMQEDSGDDFFTDPDKGQDLIIKRTGSTINNTKYSCQLTGQKAKLDDVFPEWAEKFIEDTLERVELRMQDRATQKETAMNTFLKDLDWEELAEVGL